MKQAMLIALTLLFCGTAAAPALAEQDFMQLVDPDRMVMLDMNNDHIVNGHDWVLMSAGLKENAVFLICLTRLKVGAQAQGQTLDLTKNGMASLIKTTSLKVINDLNFFYSIESNRDELVSTEATSFFSQELP